MKTLRFFNKHKQFTLFLILAFVILGIAIFAPWIATKDPYLAVMSDSLMPPGGEYILGTDKLGRDVFSRIIYGTRTSLTMTLCVVLVIFIVGTTLGILAGFFGGVIDEIIMRFSDMMVSFPGLVLAIAIAGLLGPSMVNAIIAITAVSWTKYARLARSLVIKIKNSQYIEAAYVIGTKKRNIITRYIVPNILSTMIVTAATDIATMMLELAALSFLGFGAQAPTPEWGLMLNEGRTYLAKAPWLMIYPGIAIMIVVVVFNMLGDSIRDIWDPKEK
ncbi:nickel transporter permease [Clostridium sp. 1001271B_151109_B4]|uniref:nickel transporter permease n=1 Tax=Clostridium sp. 1001271B_151109_B4 TaxID=2787148 RepID=UPI0018A92566|nr:nickel transporter permease [Clostridium sp. 1001271B_151109_B4]